VFLGNTGACGHPFLTPEEREKERKGEKVSERERERERD